MKLRAEMKTTQDSTGTGITQFYTINSGLQSYARKNGRPNAVAVNSEIPTFSNVVAEIDFKRPALQSYWGQDYFGDHTVTVVGYKEFVRTGITANSYYVVVKNNFVRDTTNNIYVRWGTWKSSVLTKFTP